MSILPAAEIHIRINEFSVARAQRFITQAAELGQRHAANPADADVELDAFFQDAAGTLAPGASLERLVPAIERLRVGETTTSPFRRRVVGASDHDVAVLRGLISRYNNARFMNSAEGLAAATAAPTQLNNGLVDNVVAVPLFRDGTPLPGTAEAWDLLATRMTGTLGAEQALPLKLVFPLSAGLTDKDARTAVAGAMMERRPKNVDKSTWKAAVARLVLLVGDKYMTAGEVDMEKVGRAIGNDRIDWYRSVNLRLDAVGTEGLLLGSARQYIALYLVNLLNDKLIFVPVSTSAESMKYADIQA
jgi:hypothetical protein